MRVPDRRLKDLISVGPATLRDFEMLGIRSVEHLRRRNPSRMYERLCEIVGRPIDVCCHDVLEAAVAQARDPMLPAVKCQWWYWSRRRKARDAPR
jgi:hypothetical protein